MAKWVPISMRRTGQCVAITFVLHCAAFMARAQGGIPLPPLPSDAPFSPTEHKESLLIEPYPEQPSQPPAFTIPLGPLGFSKPGVFYLLRRQSLVSLDFLDENRLLFTFHVQQLMRREDAGDAEGKERQIRAVVVTLPDGKIESQAQWSIPDRFRYLWMLKDGHFLLRDADGIEQGDSTLKTTPYLRLPGRLVWLAMDATQKVVVTNSLETVDMAQNPGGSAAPAAGPAAAAPDQSKPDQSKPDAVQILVVRTLERESGHQIQITRVPWTNQTTDWPITSEGYFNSSRGSGREWLLTLQTFAGGSKVIGHVDSSCAPTADYLSATELLVSTCDPGGGRLVAMSATGDRLWEKRRFSNVMWPLVVTSQDGSRLVQEILILKRTTNRYKHPVGENELVGQMATVFDAANGKVTLEAPLTPILDGGGNVAISPSGRRVAILNAGAIQVFELEAPSRLLTLPSVPSTH
jgi:hypothetical protein